ncbi:MAG: hypothetical protein EB058_16110, partial [Proteobacteria bacterium]|nr:hypothetical protein [Pseudomonadota bacterium]
GDDVLIGWAQSIGPLSGRSAWTFEAWVNPSDLTGPRTIYSEQDASGADTLVIRLRRDAQPQVLEVGLRRSGILTWFGVEAPADIVTGTWTHVAVTFEVGSRLQLAINGTVRLADTNGANGRLAAPDLAIASTLARAGDGSPGYVRSDGLTHASKVHAERPDSGPIDWAQPMRTSSPYPSNATAYPA